jgi:hypothetical protein
MAQILGSFVSAGRVHLPLGILLAVLLSFITLILIFGGAYVSVHVDELMFGEELSFGRHGIYWACQVLTGVSTPDYLPAVSGPQLTVDAFASFTGLILRCAFVASFAGVLMKATAMHSASRRALLFLFGPALLVVWFALVLIFAGIVCSTEVAQLTLARPPMDTNLVPYAACLQWGVVLLTSHGISPIAISSAAWARVAPSDSVIALFCVAMVLGFLVNCLVIAVFASAMGLWITNMTQAPRHNSRSPSQVPTPAAAHAPTNPAASDVL